ncbi:hypothetical protein B0H17DRAFT_1126136 [Mycena rosella]|uniref:Uncharacterized protein n=1 Tax=Mycena rosella TaxID=1033263 RepID=A0AAD7GU58_MYCRO|nr:hypothetical protein B0H17DRAFT_1126136 [Mycena rosella]
MFSTLLTAVPAAYTFLLLSWHLFRRHPLTKNNGFGDLSLLQHSRNPTEKIKGTAVVCGGRSVVTGLIFTLKALLDYEQHAFVDHFERILIVESEAWLASEEGRKVDGWDHKVQRTRVMQSISLHGAFVRVPWSAYKFKLPKTMYASRAGFETFLRCLVLDRDSYPNIEFITGTVTDVKLDPADHSQLSAVVVRRESGVQEFAAALVADCPGPTRAGMKWLERNGYGYSPTYPAGKLPLDQLKISFDQKLPYAFMMFHINPAFHNRLPFPEDLKGAKPIYSFLEDGVDKGRIIVIVFVGHYGTIRSQPKNLAELKDYVRGLYTVQPIPTWVFEVIDNLEEIEDSAMVSLLKVAPTTYIRYHRATNLPSNWTALGDSVMTPLESDVLILTSEDCTKVFRSALALHKVLLGAQAKSGNTLPFDFSTKFFREQFDKSDWSWQNTRIMGA